MMRWARAAAFGLLVVGCAGLPVAAQNSVQQNVTVVVLNALPQPPQPVKAVRVSLSYLDSSVLVTDAQEVTNSQGQALLLVSRGVSQRGDLRIQVTGANDLVVYQPADGQLPALPAAVKVSLLPKGSPALLGPSQIEAMLHRTLLQVNSLQKQVSALKQNTAAAQQGSDLGAAIGEFAEANGFSADHVNEQVQQWAQKIQGSSAPSTAEQKALAELALKHYASAARLFDQASDVDRRQIGSEEAQEQSVEAQIKALQAAQLAMLDKLRSPLRQLLDHSEQAASAYQLNLQFHQATQTLVDAAATAESEYKKHPDDKGFHELWLQALSSAALARSQEGDVAPANQSLPLLAQSADDFQSLSQQYDGLGDRPSWANAQNGIGIALMNEGERTSGDKAIALLDQAQHAIQKSLEVYTKADLPQNWAGTQMILANALANEGVRAAGDKALALLDRAVETFRQALQVYTKSDQPRNWAKTQNGLGTALREEAERTGGDKATALFDQSVQAYRNALEVQTKADLPQDWAASQIDLGNVLLREGEAATRDKAVPLFNQAVEAYRKSLEVDTQADLPQEWAGTQMNIGIALEEEANRTMGDKALALFDQAVESIQKSLEVFTKADLPQDWASVQNSLGNALKSEADRTANSGKAVALLNDAENAYQRALEVYTKADLPQDWARLQVSLGNTLKSEADLVGADKAIPLLEQAVQAFQNALEVRTEADLPQDWAQTQNSLGMALKDEADHASGDKAVALFDQAVQAYQNALQVYSKTGAPQAWAQTQNNLGFTLMSEGDRVGGDKADALFGRAVEVFQNPLQVFTQAGSPGGWAQTQNYIGAALLEQAMRASGDKAAALLTQAEQAFKNSLEVYTKTTTPVKWAGSHEGLALVYMQQKNYDAAAQEYDLALQAQPNSAEILSGASELYQQKIFRYDRALELDEHRVQLDASAVNRVDLVEANLTAGHFDECMKQDGMLANGALSPAQVLARDTLMLACQWASGNKLEALSAAKSISSQAAKVDMSSLNFAGVLHFLSTAPAFESCRASWIALFTAVQNGDRAGMTAALHQLEPLLQK